MTRIFDCFTFHNEWDLLRLRLAMLREAVDHVVIAEATTTFAGRPRTPVLTPDRVKELGPNVHVVLVDDMPIGPDPWPREWHQRRSLARGLADLGASPTDIALVTDVDEIPNPDLVARLPGMLEGSAVELTMRYLQYRVNLEIGRPWPLARAAVIGAFTDPQELRERTGLPRIADGGWHLTYLGDEHRALSKLRDFSHQELRGIYDSEVHLRRCLRYHVDLIGRFPMRVLDPEELPLAMRSGLRDRPEYWAVTPGTGGRLLGSAYGLVTRHRPRLGAAICDRAPAVAFAGAVAIETAIRTKRVLCERRRP
jgi:hypothetical protein